MAMAGNTVRTARVCNRYDTDNHSTYKTRARGGHASYNRDGGVVVRQEFQRKQHGRGAEAYLLVVG